MLLENGNELNDVATLNSSDGSGVERHRASGRACCESVVVALTLQEAVAVNQDVCSVYARRRNLE